MSKTSLSFILLLICFVQNALASLAAHNARWEKPNVVVCWANWNEIYDPAWVSKTTFIREAIEAEFNTRTPIKFTGWKACTESKNADAVLSFTFREGTSSSSRASIGRGESPDHNNLYSYVYLDSEDVSSLKEMLELKQTALHEFGHLAGLMHEHLREEAKGDQNCIEFRNYERVGIKRIPPNISLITIGEYDPHSIMNYCFNEKMSREGLEDSLSSGDIKTLQELYSDFKAK